jgi:four helix bundle protein
MKDFRELKVWEKAHHLVLAVYKATDIFPRQELYSLTNQIQRAVVSIPANIAEGCGKNGDADFGRYLQIAMGSSSELEYLLLLAHDLHYLSDETYQTLSSQLIETGKMLNSLITRLKTNHQPLTANS